MTAWAMLALAALAPAPASAQGMRRVVPFEGDCRALLPPARNGALRPWQSFVHVEHCDRIKRLTRLSLALPPERRPMFFEGVIPADRLPSEFGVDVPVLRVVFPDSVFFDTARTELRFEAETLVQIIAESLRREPPDVALFVAGHADRRGAADYNSALSIDRADALATAIYRQGVNFSSLWRVGFGEDMPLVDGEDEWAWDRNRRIEFLFGARPEAVGTWLADQQLDELCQARTRAGVARCKARLNLRADYQAIEIKARPTVAVNPVRPPDRRPVAPHRRVGRAVEPARGSAIATAPRTGATTSIAPRMHGTVAISPTPGRTMAINPIARSAKTLAASL